jgi:hypothetical protein
LLLLSAVVGGSDSEAPSLPFLSGNGFPTWQLSLPWPVAGSRMTVVVSSSLPPRAAAGSCVPGDGAPPPHPSSRRLRTFANPREVTVESLTDIFIKIRSQSYHLETISLPHVEKIPCMPQKNLADVLYAIEKTDLSCMPKIIIFHVLYAISVTLTVRWMDAVSGPHASVG